MNRAWRTIVFSATAMLIACEPITTPAEQKVVGVLSDTDIDGYRRAEHPREFDFPKDHGAHPGFKHEWWYLTGHLSDGRGRRFGYQFTLFRRALSPENEPRSSSWATSQLFLAHLALTDVYNKRFHHDERYARGALALAGVNSVPFRAWLEDWSLTQHTTSCPRCLDVTLRAVSEPFALQLTLRNQRAPVLHGDRGLSRKSDTPGNASYYYSYPRMLTSGDVVVNGERHRVSGSSWFDHEWSTSALETGQTGWDWFSLHLSDDSELMLFRLRHQDPKRSRYSGTLVTSDTVRNLDSEKIVFRATDYWRSPHSAVRYPQSWRIEIPSLGSDLSVTPLLADQEMNVSFRYWEGAIKVSGRHRGRPATGDGYMELTGYR